MAERGTKTSELREVFTDNEGYLLAINDDPSIPVDPNLFKDNDPARAGRVVKRFLIKAENVPAVVNVDPVTRATTRNRIDPSFMADYAAPTPATVTRRQFFQGLAAGSLITQQESLDAMAGQIPASMMNYILTNYIATDRFSQTMVSAGAETFSRDDELVTGWLASLGQTPVQIDDLFRMMATL
jgi:hypothetical protein